MFRDQPRASCLAGRMRVAVAAVLEAVAREKLGVFPSHLKLSGGGTLFESMDMTPPASDHLGKRVFTVPM